MEGQYFITKEIHKYQAGEKHSTHMNGTAGEFSCNGGVIFSWTH